MTDAPVALVTGGARRVGAAISRALAARGMHVAVHYHRSEAEAQALVAELRTAGMSATAFTADLSDPHAPAALVHAVADRLGGLDVLVNSAANFLRTPMGSVSLEQWESVFALNVRAPFFATQAAAERMREGGVIINMADLAAFEQWSGYIPHGISKAAIVQLTRAAAHTLAPRIRVNAIAPGVVLLPEGWDDQSEARLTATTPLKRTGSPEDVVHALLYLVDATFVTGEVLIVDGGRQIR
ncbi:MAG: SDR family oxidoreductase [Gemmatimonadaceae bacterium]